jgi:small basic protein
MYPLAEGGSASLGHMAVHILAFCLFLLLLLSLVFLPVGVPAYLSEAIVHLIALADKLFNNTALLVTQLYQLNHVEIICCYTWFGCCCKLCS